MSGVNLIKKLSANSALVGAGLAVGAGLLLWGTPLGEPWENISYDCLFNFGARPVTNQVVIVQMDLNNRNTLRERGQHAQLLDKLTDDGARLVVFDVHFQGELDSKTDEALAGAMRRNGHVVLMGDVSSQSDDHLDSASVDLPLTNFLAAAAGFGVGRADAPTGQVARRHWPFRAPGEGHFHSLGWVTAELFGARLDRKVEKQWLRYYGRTGPGERLPYAQALAATPGFFRGKIIFIGGWPQRPNDPGEPEPDKFLTPYSGWSGQAIGGIEINATTFLNLVNGDWLRRPKLETEFLLIVGAGILLGGGLCRLRPLPALLVALGVFITLLLFFVSWSYFTNWWFPWLVIAGGQLPLALAWAWAAGKRAEAPYVRHPGYVEVGGTFGEGAFGNVRVVRNATGQLQALKEVVLAKFADDENYEREFRGIKFYKPFSSQHPGLLHVDYVNRNEEDGYFFYVMELGDAMDPGWEQSGVPYRPRDLHNVHRALPDGRLPVRESLRIGITLLEALDFLHQRGLVHRDIKPANIVFVNGQPKLADVGLVRDASAGSTLIGTPDFMPPALEPTGTKTADIYALGKVLYVISTGNPARNFPELSTTLVAKPEFMRLNEIICCACHPLADQRYASAAEMLAALRTAQAELDADSTQQF